MANRTQIRPWSRLASLRSAPTLQSHIPPSIASSFKASQTRSTSSLDNNDEKPITFPPSKLKVNSENETKTRIPVEEDTKTVHVNKTVEKTNDSLRSECSGTRVITIAGENRGADMEIIQSRKKPFHKNQKMRRLYVNSNVQCVNNSMMLHTSCTHHDPGMHLRLSNKPLGERVAEAGFST